MDKQQPSADGVASNDTTPVAFHFGDHNVRTIDKDGEVWFVANDVCEVLEIANPRNATARLDDDEKDAVQITDAMGRAQQVTVINESGLYSLILSSRKADAKKFKRWVTHDVLPAIRSRGSYENLPPAPPAPPIAPPPPSQGFGDPDDDDIDVGALLLGGQSDPTVPLPRDVEKAIDAKAWDMAREAYELSKEHLQRRVAYTCEFGHPVRKLDIRRAMDVLSTHTLGKALSHVYQSELASVMTMAEMHVTFGNQLVSRLKDAGAPKKFKALPHKR